LDHANIVALRVRISLLSISTGTKLFYFIGDVHETFFDCFGVHAGREPVGISRKEEAQLAIESEGKTPPASGLQLKLPLHILDRPRRCNWYIAAYKL